MLNVCIQGHRSAEEAVLNVWASLSPRTFGGFECNKWRSETQWRTSFVEGSKSILPGKYYSSKKEKKVYYCGGKKHVVAQTKLEWLKIKEWEQRDGVLLSLSPVFAQNSISVSVCVCVTSKINNIMTSAWLRPQSFNSVLICRQINSPKWSTGVNGLWSHLGGWGSRCWGGGLLLCVLNCTVQPHSSSQVTWLIPPGFNPQELIAVLCTIWRWWR